MITQLMRRATSGTSRFHEARRELEEMQLKTFTRWWNASLDSSAPMEDLCEEVRSGVRAVVLLEALEHSALPFIPRKPTPKNRFERLANWKHVLDFLTDRRHLHLVNISAEDLEDGRRTQILGLTWKIIKRYEGLAEPRGSTGGQRRNRLTSPKELNAWAFSAAAAEDYGAGDTSSKASLARLLRTGRTLCSLLRRHKPEYLTLQLLARGADSIEACSPEERLTIAIETAVSLGVPRLLDVDDLVAGRVDDDSALIYVARLRCAIDDDAAAERAEAQQAMAESSASERAQMEAMKKKAADRAAADALMAESIAAAETAEAEVAHRLYAERLAAARLAAVEKAAAAAEDDTNTVGTVMTLIPDKGDPPTTRERPLHKSLSSRLGSFVRRRSQAADDPTRIGDAPRQERRSLVYSRQHSWLNKQMRVMASSFAEEEVEHVQTVALNEMQINTLPTPMAIPEAWEAVDDGDVITGDCQVATTPAPAAANPPYIDREVVTLGPAASEPGLDLGELVLLAVAVAMIVCGACLALPELISRFSAYDGSTVAGGAVHAAPNPKLCEIHHTMINWYTAETLRKWGCLSTA